jgi:hypothetical protein
VSAAAAVSLKRTVLERFPAGGPRGSGRRSRSPPSSAVQGVPARVVMDLDSDSFLVIVEVAS